MTLLKAMRAGSDVPNIAGLVKDDNAKIARVAIAIKGGAKGCGRSGSP